ncbi:winged helix-turn-helix domain-containing protein [Thermodesulfobacteriota bacterium]
MSDRTRFDYKQLDEIIHSRIRLAIMSILVSVSEAEFTFLRDQIKATDGNLSIHLKKLEDARYVSVKKGFLNRKPVSTYKLTTKGHNAFKVYVERLEKILKK